jgi:glutathione S-transferase
LNPRLAVAAARFLKSPVEFEFASPFSAGQREKLLKLNPNLSVPILIEGDKTLWEADAIACRLSQLANSDFWPMGDPLPDVVRWISWGYWNFVRACDRVHFERVTKQRYGIGPVRQDLVESGLKEFVSSADVLEQRRGGLARRKARHLCRFPCRLRLAFRGPRRPAARGFSARRSLACAANGYPGQAGSVRGAGCP